MLQDPLVEENANILEEVQLLWMTSTGKRQCW